MEGEPFPKRPKLLKEKKPSNKEGNVCSLPLAKEEEHCQADSASSPAPSAGELPECGQSSCSQPFRSSPQHLASSPLGQSSEEHSPGPESSETSKGPASGRGHALHPTDLAHSPSGACSQPDVAPEDPVPSTSSGGSIDQAATSMEGEEGICTSGSGTVSSRNHGDMFDRVAYLIETLLGFLERTS